MHLNIFDLVNIARSYSNFKFLKKLTRREVKQNLILDFFNMVNVALSCKIRILIDLYILFLERPDVKNVFWLPRRYSRLGTGSAPLLVFCPAAAWLKPPPDEYRICPIGVSELGGVVEHQRESNHRCVVLVKKGGCPDKLLQFHETRSGYLSKYSNVHTVKAGYDSFIHSLSYCKCPNCFVNLSV